MTKKSRIGKSASLIRNVYERFNFDDGFPLSGNIAFSALLAFFPFLIFLTALAGFLGDAALAQAVIDYLFSVFPRAIIAPLSDDIHSLLTVQSSGILTISILVTLYAAAGGVESIRLGLNRAYGYREKRVWPLRFLQNLAFVIGWAFVLILLAVLIVFAPPLWAQLVTWFPFMDPFTVWFDLLRYPIALGMMFFALLMGHLFLPRKRQSIRVLLPGIGLTMGLWLIAAQAYAEYTARFSRAELMYAGLGNVVIALVFVYLSSLLVLLGAELNQVLLLKANAQGGPK
jgi:membrane protein